MDAIVNDTSLLKITGQRFCRMFYCVCLVASLHYFLLKCLYMWPWCPENLVSNELFELLQWGIWESGVNSFLEGPAWTPPISGDGSPSCSCQRSLPSLYFSEWDLSSWESAETETREEILVDLNFFRVMQLFSSQEFHIVQILDIGTLFGILLRYHLGWTHNFWSTILDNVARHNLGWKIQ